MKLYALITLLLSAVMFFFPFLSVSRVFSERSPNENKNSTIVISDINGENKEEMDMFDYIVGTVAAEMPASFEYEALKAQAVASYTYQKYLRENGTKVITDSSIHQEFKSDEELKELWGEDYEKYKEKITSAVESVYGEYLIYDGETIPALYHAISPGTTESAEVIFGKKVNCLSGATAPGDRLSPKHSEEVSFTLKETESILKKQGISLNKKGKKLIEVSKKTESGYPTEVKIIDKAFSGNEVRDMFGLKSPYFEAEESEEGIIFTVYGRGHGVGMSQYSADYMARQGFTYKDILLHFYKGAEIADNTFTNYK